MGESFCTSSQPLFASPRFSLSILFSILHHKTSFWVKRIHTVLFVLQRCNRVSPLSFIFHSTCHNNTLEMHHHRSSNNTTSHPEENESVEEEFTKKNGESTLREKIHYLLATPTRFHVKIIIFTIEVVISAVFVSSSSRSSFSIILHHPPSWINDLELNNNNDQRVRRMQRSNKMNPPPLMATRCRHCRVNEA